LQSRELGPDPEIRNGEDKADHQQELHGFLHVVEFYRIFDVISVIFAFRVGHCEAVEPSQQAAVCRTPNLGRTHSTKEFERERDCAASLARRQSAWGYVHSSNQVPKTVTHGDATNNHGLILAVWATLVIGLWANGFINAFLPRSTGCRFNYRWE
jgi:hypothetical protein